LHNIPEDVNRQQPHCENLKLNFNTKISEAR